MKVLFSPSIMCANLLELKKDISELVNAQADFFHIDIMDGNFVPNIALNVDLIKAIKSVSDTKMDVHLMVTNPETYIDALCEAGADYVTFHDETVRFPIRLINEIHKKGMKAGVALSPKKRAEDIYHYLEYLDMILVMSVEPGFAGQKMIATVYDKIILLKSMIDEKKPDIILEMDGSINLETAINAVKCGVNSLVLGTSSIFKKDVLLYDGYMSFKKRLEECLI